MAISIPTDCGSFAGAFGNNLQQQFNVTDSLSRIVGAHQIKLGSIIAASTPKPGSNPTHMQYFYFPCQRSERTHVPLAACAVRNSAKSQLVFFNWSLFAQDTWKATRALTVTYGLRWEYKPRRPRRTDPPFTVTQVNNLATMTLAPRGTPLWHPQKHDFAPRLGLAWQVRPNLVIRAGAGIFYDSDTPKWRMGQLHGRTAQQS